MKVSIVITTRNRYDYLMDAINSVLAQTYENDIELIIVDDCSNDETIDLTSETAHIKVIRNYVNIGQTLSLIKGIEASCGDLIGWLDDDDFLHPDCINECIACMRNTNSDLVYTKYYLCNAQSQILGLGNRANVPYSPNQLLTHFMTFHFRLFKRSVYDFLGGLDSNYFMCQDYDFCLRVSEQFKISLCPKPLYYYRVHSGSASLVKQLEQLKFSSRAVEAAIERRGLNLDLVIVPQFMLKIRC